MCNEQRSLDPGEPGVRERIRGIYRVMLCCKSVSNWTREAGR